MKAAVTLPLVAFQLGEPAAFTTVRWHALDGNGHIARDTLTTYHLLATLRVASSPTLTT